MSMEGTDLYFDFQAIGRHWSLTVYLRPATFDVVHGDVDYLLSFLP